MNKADREKVLAKTAGHCAYCGVELPSKGWHLDHIKPLLTGSLRGDMNERQGQSIRGQSCGEHYV